MVGLMNSGATLDPHVTVQRATSWPEALARLAEDPGLAPICGGTDIMVNINFGRSRPEGLLDLTGLSELGEWSLVDDGQTIRIGAAVTYKQIIAEISDQCPALAIAARTVGSPQIRNRGTIGGNLATASPAGDAIPPLLATGAQIEVASVAGSRLIDIDDFFIGPKLNSLAADELIRAVLVPVARGPQQFAKIGPRNAMVIAVASFAVALDTKAGKVGTGIGSAGPTPLRAATAEQFAARALEGKWDDPESADSEMLREFGRLAASDALPIDDVRGTADYRRHSLSVLAARCLSWAWSERSVRSPA